MNINNILKQGILGLMLVSSSICIQALVPAGALPPAGIDGVSSPIAKQDIQGIVRLNDVPAVSSAPINTPPAVSRRMVTANYTMAQLAAMPVEEAVNIMAGLGSAYEISDLFQFNEGAKLFYLNEELMQALLERFEEAGRTFTIGDDKGFIAMVEILRAGPFLGFYNPDLAALNKMEFKERFVPAFMALVNNPNFGWSPKHGLDAFDVPFQDQMIKALGSCIGSGVTSLELMAELTKLLKQFNDENLMRDPAKASVLYTLLGGIDYALYWDVQVNAPGKPEESKYYNQVNDYIAELGRLALYGPKCHADRMYLVNNAIFWIGYNSGKLAPVEQVANVLKECLDTYEEFSTPWIETARRIGEDSRYNALIPEVDYPAIKQKLHDKYLPKKYSFDNGRLVFITGDKVDPDKIKMLYWATKEVEAQFQRLLLRDEPIDPEQTCDDVLTAYVYNSPAEYQLYNQILYGLATNNGGMYIEGWGKFFTYERTRQESTLSLEDLFRHEYNHFLQGRYLCPGGWGGGNPLYANDRITWVEEGGAEFQAGSVRIGGVPQRWSMVVQISGDPNGRMTLPQIVKSSYATGGYYTYGYVVFQFLYEKHIGDLLHLFQLIQNARDTESIQKIDDFFVEFSQKYNDEFMPYMDNLYNNLDKFDDPNTPYDYYKDVTPRDCDELVAEIVNTASLAESQVSKLYSEDFNTLEVRGTYTLGTSNGATEDWVAMDKKADELLTELTGLNWNGYKTMTAHFIKYSVNEANEATFELAFKGLLPAEPSAVNNIGEDVKGFTLSQNMPNPAVDQTTIQFTTEEEATVSLKVYTQDGRLLRTPLSRLMMPGAHSIQLDVTGLADGLYFYTLEANGKQLNRKMVIAR